MSDEILLHSKKQAEQAIKDCPPALIYCDPYGEGNRPYLAFDNYGAAEIVANYLNEEAKKSPYNQSSIYHKAAYVITAYYKEGGHLSLVGIDGRGLVPQALDYLTYNDGRSPVPSGEIGTGSPGNSEARDVAMAAFAKWKDAPFPSTAQEPEALRHDIIGWAVDRFLAESLKGIELGPEHTLKNGIKALFRWDVRVNAELEALTTMFEPFKDALHRQNDGLEEFRAR